jgi:hypothetical protein
MDDLYAKTDERLHQIEVEYNDSTSPNYQNGLWYRQQRADALSDAYVLREDYYKQHPVKSFAPTTQEQKWAADYNERVLKASVVDGESDYLLQEGLDRQWRWNSGPEASSVIDREYVASTSRLDGQFRADTIFLRPYYEFLDGAWSQDFIYSSTLPVTLPMLSNGQTPLNFRTSSEYRSALRRDFLKKIQDAGRVPAAFISTVVGDKTLGELFPDRLTDTQARYVSNVLTTRFMKPFYDKLDPAVELFLKQNPKFLEPLLRWDYKPGSAELAPYLP